MTTVIALLEKNALITAFVVVALILAASNWLAARLFRGQIHGSAIAITVGLLLAYWGGLVGGGSKGLADVSFFSGLGVLGGAMFRDFAIVATAFGAELDALKRAGWVGAMSQSRSFQSSATVSSRFCGDVTETTGSPRSPSRGRVTGASELTGRWTRSSGKRARAAASAQHSCTRPSRVS